MRTHDPAEPRSDAHDHAQHHAHDLEPERVTGRVVAVLAVLVLAALVAMLNETALSVALPAVMGDLHVSAAVGQWLTTGFLLTMAIVIPTTGYLLRRFTTRALFGAALAVFLLGTVTAAVAPSFGLLLAGRVLQAGGTAIILPQLMATTLSTVPARHRGTVMGLNAVVISAAPALGPTISGFVVESFGWRWLFLGMIPIAAVLLVASLIVLHTDGATRRPPFDLASVLLSAVAFGGIVYALSTLGALVDGDVVPAIALVVGAAGLLLFVRRQLGLARTSGAPLLDIAPLSVGVFRRSTIIIGLCMATMLGTVIVLPLHLVGAMGVDALTTGLLLLPGGLVQGVISPLAGRIFDAHGPRPLVIPGAFLLLGGQAWLSTIGVDTSLTVVVAAHVVFCVGMACLMTPLMTVSLGSLPRDLYGHGSAIVNTVQQLSGAVGTGVFVAVMTIGIGLADAGASAGDTQALGTRAAFVVGIVAGLVAVAMSFTIRAGRDSASTTTDGPAVEDGTTGSTGTTADDDGAALVGAVAGPATDAR
ncbi:MDR family MFS transporter [Georgenia sp. Z1344]|uniref:MDR family MFS transporter n=1 Tax=Georgenia sp. Z1344 TaxID=3416706 RepID=UPI003CFBA967